MDMRAGLLAVLRRRVGLRVLTLLTILSLGSGATLLVVGSRAAHAATATITTCDYTHVFNAISGAAPGDTVQFGCGGTITVTSTLIISKNLILDGNGHNVTLDGGNAVQVLNVAGGATVATLNDLTISDGAANFAGGGIGNAGNLTITNSTIS